MNALKNRMFQIAVGLLVVGVLVLLVPRAAHAVVAALVQVVNTTANPVPNQDVDNAARNFYQELESSFSCTSPCAVVFNAVPTGKRLIVEQVSALVTINVTGGTPPADVELRGTGGSGVFQFIPIVAAPANFGAETQFTAHAGVLASYDAGQVPNVDAFVPSNQSMTVLASISGHMINIP